MLIVPTLESNYALLSKLYTRDCSLKSRSVNANRADMQQRAQLPFFSFSRSRSRSRSRMWRTRRAHLGVVRGILPFFVTAAWMREGMRGSWQSGW
ncbi:hypothetical protein IE81DRAFT_126092 [Ceraceosorus guamensis]|uniref:Uncharacterized protein n=1 Tax=Ceraceosorus guamensis TaxID=1522189 RepID=A0A316W7H4_9BASI|nr:hypothetical protein IE81DRAFT_126092 [Ceraceosorus guamensis]PWN45772.1 hypothetical protein IE81DRAFT_126092 [Ceraceosorus guamensis]